jgi:hypothetical protein
MNPEPGSLPAGSGAGFAITGTGVASGVDANGDSAGVAVVTSAGVPGIWGVLMMIWTHPDRKMMAARSTRTDSPVTFMNLESFSYRLLYLAIIHGL